MKRSFVNLFETMSSSTSSDSSNKEMEDDDSTERLLRTYKLNDKLFLTVVQGSVVDFRSKKGAIVNAANEECLGGGGVDGAITKAGGQSLYEDRLKLTARGWVRCPTGDAKLTGPGQYGSLGVPYVIHAVGPNYLMFDEEKDLQTPHSLLRSAYTKSMDCCAMGEPIEMVAFALLSAGVFRGSQSRATVLAIGVEAIRDWSKNETKMSRSVLQDVVLYAFTDREAQTLLAVCDQILGDNPQISPPPPPVEEKQDNFPHTIEEQDSSAPDDKKGEKNGEKADDKAEAAREDSNKQEEPKLEQTTKVQKKPEAEAKKEDQEMTDTEAKECPSDEEAVAEKAGDKEMTDTEAKESPSPAKSEGKKKNQEMTNTEAKDAPHEVEE